jgi:hypothetical protein
MMITRSIFPPVLVVLCWMASALMIGACAPAETTPVAAPAHTAIATPAQATPAQAVVSPPAPTPENAPAGAVQFDASGYPLTRVPPPTVASIRFEAPDNFGVEISLEDMITMAQAGKVSRIEWFADTDLVRVFTTGGGVCHVKNERYKADIPRALMQAGVAVGDDGLEIAFET